MPRGMRRGLVGGLLLGAGVRGARNARHGQAVQVIKCTACGVKNEADNKFCGDCGGQLQNICSYGAMVKSGKKFCCECGKAVS